MKGKNAEYQEKLDHLRFFAALLVILFHSVMIYNTVCSTHPVCKLNGGISNSEPPFFSLILEGHTAVALFMTLSGFLFATICKGKEINHWAFYRNRFLRIYPLFIAVLLVSCYMDMRTNDFTRLVTALFFMQNTISGVYLLNGTESLWAIAVEFQFYLLFPWLLIFFHKYGYKYLIGLTVLAVLIRLALYLAVREIYMICYMTIFGRIDQFVIGMIYGFLFERMKTRLRHPIILGTAVASVLAFISFYHKCGWSNGGPHWIVATDLEAMFWGFLIVSYNAGSFSFPKSIARLLAFGGTLSYSLYLIHPWVMRLAYWIAPIIYSPHSRFPLLAQLASYLSHHSYIAGLSFGLVIAFPVTFVVSIFTYRLIEKPFLELRTKYIIPSRDKLEELEEPEKLPAGTRQLVGAKD